MLYVNPMATSAGRAVAGIRPMGGAAVAEAAQAKEKEALQEFERLFLFQMLREMRKSVPKDGLFGRSSQQDFMEELFDDHLAGEMARTGQFGIAKQMEAQLASVRRPHAGLAALKAGTQGA